jgi:diguanylate cyclase (GGDEF)-like protein
MNPRAPTAPPSPWSPLAREDLPELYREKLALFRPVALVVMVAGMALAAFGLIAWDYAIDPVGAPRAIPYRLLEVPALGGFALLLHLDRWPLPRGLAFALSMLASQALLFPILAPLKDGSLIGAGAPLYWFVFLPLVALGLTLGEALGGLAVLAVAPLVWRLVGWAPDLLVDVFLMYTWPTAAVIAGILTINDRLVLRMIQDRRRLDAARAEAERLAQTDPLTGLNNRRAFMERGEALFARARRTGTALSFILLDLDHFKWVNDTHGHAAGDAVIQALAQVLGDHAREGDVLGRLGGEEFAVLLPGADAATAWARAEDLRVTLGDRVVLPGVLDLRRTASFGVSSLADGARSLDVLIAQADDALYAAKNAGRNRIHAHGAPPSNAPKE